MNTQQDSQSSMLSPSPPNQADEPHKDSEPHLSCLSRRPYALRSPRNTCWRAHGHLSEETAQ